MPDFMKLLASGIKKNQDKVVKAVKTLHWLVSLLRLAVCLPRQVQHWLVLLALLVLRWPQSAVSALG